MIDKNTATFAGGCFWCMVPPFEKIKGVLSVKSGYMGGKLKNPTYEQVCSGSTGHQEVVQVTFDPSTVSYEEIVNVFWQEVDPTDEGGQFGDRGTQYQTVIFYHDEEQKKVAEESKKKLQESGRFEKEIATVILPTQEFYQAEEYHQDYHKKNPVRYRQYRSASGRDDFLKKHWKIVVT